MKHTDFWQRIQEIKAQELRELKNALEKVGGSYEWEDLFEAPLITLRIGGIKNEYMIKEIKLGDCCLATVVKYVDERVILANQPVSTSNVEVGDLSNITELLPGDEDVSERQEDFVVVTVSREDLKEKGFDADSLDDSTMQSIAKRMGNAYLDEQYWLDMEIVAEEGLGLRRIWDVWFDNVDLVDLAKFLVEARGINFERPSDTDEGCHEFVEAVYHWWSLLANWQKEQIYYEYKNKQLWNSDLRSVHQ